MTLHNASAMVTAEQTTADWVSSHSQMVMGLPIVPGEGYNNSQEEAIDLQCRATSIIDKKKRERREKTQSTGATLKPNLGTCLNVGVRHLKKLDLVPKNFGHRTLKNRELSTEEDEDTDMERMTRSRATKKISKSNVTDMVHIGLDDNTTGDCNVREALA